MGAQIPAPSGYFNQTYTIEFDVPGSLDGSTLVPQNITAPSENEDPQQIYRPVVEDNAGLFDVDYVVREGPEQRGVAAFRVIHQVWIFSPVVGGANASIEVVDAVDGPIIVQEVQNSLVGEQTFFRDDPFLVPQGSLLRIRGFENNSGIPIRVRLTVQYTNDLVAAQQAVCACGDVTPSGGGGGGGGEITIEQDGVDVGTTDTLNFTGDVDVTPDGDRINIAIVVPTWQEVYRLDVAALPDANLNSPGASVIIDGVRWRTFAAAATGQNMVAATGSFGLVQGVGLEVVGAANSRVNATTMNGNFIYTSLAELAANTATPFAGDPHAEYMFQARIVNQVADQTSEWSGVMICRFVNTVSESGNLFGNATTWRCGIGFFDGVANRVLGTGGPNPAPPVVYYNPLNLNPPLPATDVPYIQYTSPQSVQFGSYASQGGDFVEPGSAYQGYVTSRDPTDHEVDIVLHPVYGFFIGFGHCAESLANNYTAAIADFRVLSK